MNTDSRWPGLFFLPCALFALFSAMLPPVLLAVDKTGDSWARPTPREHLRELSTDRPDMTESPYTVDAGHLQIEASFASYTRDRHNPERDDTEVTSWNIAPVIFRIGLRHHLEVQVIADNHLQEKVVSRSTGLNQTRRGFGDVTLRVKTNLWGNDGGTTALAIMPFVKIPTNRGGVGNDSFEGGLIVPFAADLGGGWGLGAMTEFDWVRNGNDDGHQIEWLNTVTLSRDLTDRVGIFGELAAAVGQGAPAASYNMGLTYAVSSDVQLDFGVNFALTRAADDLTLFTGITTRF